MYENLKVNKDRLSSPFDIHRTLLDILEMPEDSVTAEQVNNVVQISFNVNQMTSGPSDSFSLTSSPDSFFS